LASVVLLSCGNLTKNSDDQDERKVYFDSAFTEKFLPMGDGFTGADGIYSVEIPDGRNVWIFGDTFFGHVTADNKRIKTDPMYIRNSFLVQQKDSFEFVHQGTKQNPVSIMVPPEVTDQSSGYGELNLWYWPGDGYVDGSMLNVFVSKFFQEDLNNMWGFEFRETNLVQFSLPDFKPLKVHRFANLDSIHFGHCLLEDGGYLYIYGLKNGKPFVARALSQEVLKPWEFYNGKSWSEKANEAQPILDFKGSEQFSVFKSGETYIMVMQQGGLSPDIYSFTSSAPYGPWGNKKLLYTTQQPPGCKQCFTYNALAHPQFTVDNMLLISYNTNTHLLAEHFGDALLYRPRFIRVPMELILDKKSE
jgi:hypothetical protein